MSKKAPKIKATPELVEKTSKSSQISDLVKLADIFSRASAGRSFEVQLPLFCPVKVEKGYRKHNIPVGTRLRTEGIYIGRKQGLIFQFSPVGGMDRQGDEVQLIEVQWPDIKNVMDDLVETLDDYCPTTASDLIEPLDDKVRSIIDAKPGMHKVLSQGFDLAMKRSKEAADGLMVEGLEGFGEWS